MITSLLNRLRRGRYDGRKPSSHPMSGAGQKAWLASRWPWIEVDVEGTHPEAFVHCLPVLEKLARCWPEPFAALKSIRSTPESVGWPANHVRAWYEGKGGMHLRRARWRSATDGERCEYLLSHEFGHHMEAWLLDNVEMRDVVAWFIRANFELGKEISDYAAISPGEAWAEGFEEQHNRPQAHWHEYTRRQATLLSPWKA